MSENAPAYVVGIGASAGGLQSLEKFFDSLDVWTGAAFVVVQHLSPDYETMMDKLLSRHTGMPVKIASDGERLERDSVYVIPPRQDLAVRDGCIELSDHDSAEVPHLTVDRLLFSIAKDYGDHSIGVILSGTGSDGSRGICSIREKRGLVLCESESTAKFSGMPRSAQATGCVDHVLPAESMPRIIARRILGDDEFAPDGDEMETILRMLKDRLQVDFRQYKSATVSRRIDRRMSLCNASSLADYIELLKNEPTQIDQLYQDMLIGVTKFFRDPPCFDYFEKKIAPKLFEDASPDTGLRVWTPGCATGEEAYSLAIVLHELNQSRRDPIEVKIFATDIHPGSLQQASVATYGENALENVSSERLERHFECVDGGFRLRKHIRQNVLITQHDLLQSPPFTSLDLISCRNLLIYFDNAAQSRALTLFLFGLKQGGTLFLGPSETVGELKSEFKVVHDKYRFYEKIRSARLPSNMDLPLKLSTPTEFQAPTAGPRRPVTKVDGALYDALLDRVLPPTVLIDSERRVVEMYGGSERYLSIRGRRLTGDLLDLCPKQLQSSLSVGVRRIITGERDTVRLPVTRFPGPDGQVESIGVSLRAIRQSEQSQLYIAVTFTAPQVGANAPDDEQVKSQVLLDAPSSEDELSQRVRDLELELASSETSLQSVVEELETSNEELQATNEELVSSNEELQSSNEELNSVNEELHTVNVEFQDKNAELRELNADMNHLLASIDVGVVFLDASLRVRRFTPGVQQLFLLEPHDLGRPIAAFSNKLKVDNLLERLERVATTGAPDEGEVESEDGTPYFMRILPFEQAGEQVGVTLTLTNITVLAETRRRADQHQRRLQKTIDAVPVFVAFVNRKRCYEYTNKTYSDLFGLPTDEMMGMPVREILGADSYAASEPHIERALSGEAQQFEAEIGRDDRRITVIVDYRPEFDSDGRVTGFYVSASDITSLKRVERELELAVAAAKYANEAKSDFLAKMSHEIRSPMAAILGFADVLERQLEVPDNRNCIEVIKGNGEHLLGLINDLLDLSQIEARRIALSSDVVNVATILSSTISTLKPRAVQGKVQLESRLNDNLNAGMVSDARRLRQIAINLVANALKFAAEERVIVAGRRSRRRGELLITVADSGPGIASSQIEKLFEPFTQIDSSSTRSQEGSGLGLTITKQLVTEMGGTIRVRSKQDVGSLFQVRIPWKEVLPPPEATAVSNDGDSLVRLDGYRVLLVDDRRDMRFIAEHILADVGAEVVTAASGQEALKRAERASHEEAGFNCVVTDVQMPGMDGYEVARQLRSAGYSGPIIALTANAMANDQQKCFDAGCTGFVPKPIDARRLIRAVAGDPTV